MCYRPRQAIIRLICTAFALKAGVAPATVYWIDHVEKADGGVRLFFIRGDHMAVPGSVGQQGGDFTVVNGGKVARTDADGRRTLLDYLPLNDADSGNLGQPSTDHCTLTVVNGNERVGVLAQSSLRHFGAPLTDSEEFVAAEPKGAQQNTTQNVPARLGTAPAARAIPSDPAQAMQFGIFFGGTASQHELCVKRGFLPKETRSAEQEANSILTTMEQHNQDPEGTINARKGWQLAKQQMQQHGGDFTQERCNAVVAQWKKFLTMMHSN
jgi:hypothetical protein